MRRRRGLLRGVAPALLLGFTFAAGPARGTTPRPPAQGPGIRAEVDTTVITVGDRITLTISVDHAAGSRVDWPDSLDLTPFEVLDARVEAPTAAADGVPSSLVLTLTAFEVGDLEIPGIPVEVVGPGEERATLRTSPLGIRVRSVGLDEGGDIREIKGPWSIPRSLLGVLLWGLGLLAAVALGWFLFRRIGRGRGPEEGVLPALPPRPPHEVALEALTRLEASPLLERGEVKEYHIRASEILRVYVEGRFRVPALEMTTLDLTREMARVGVDPPLLEEFRQYLHRCDMVKFAKDRPGMEASGALVALGRSLVEATVPVVEAPVEVAPLGPSGQED
ncbi:MAG: BatD family protein [Gemmatimonadota bacterium]